MHGTPHRLLGGLSALVVSTVLAGPLSSVAHGAVARGPQNPPRTSETSSQQPDQAESREATARPNETGSEPSEVAQEDALSSVQSERGLLQFRRDALNDRAATLDRWLQVVGLVLTFLGLVMAFLALVLTLLAIVIPLLALFGYNRFRKLHGDARRAVEVAEVQASRAQKKAAKANRLLHQMRDKSAEMDRIMLRHTAKGAEEDPTVAIRAAQSTLARPRASPLAVAVSEAITAQQQRDYLSAIEKWRATAIVATRTDPELASRSWFSVGFLLEMQSDLEQSSDHLCTEAIEAYDNAIQLNPTYADAYFNRANVKSHLKRHADAASDYSESIKLEAKSRVYYNRGNVHCLQRDFVKAIEDYDTALRLSRKDGAANTEHILLNKANAFLFLGELEKARHCLGEAVSEHKESEHLRRNLRVVEAISKHDSRPKVPTLIDPSADGGFILQMMLRGSVDEVKNLPLGEHHSNFGSVGSTGSIRMPGGKGGKGFGGIIFALHSESDQT